MQLRCTPKGADCSNPNVAAIPNLAGPERDQNVS
jgi:hypothetical protein